MKSTTQLNKILICAIVLFAFATTIQAQLNHQMIFRCNNPTAVAGDYNYGPNADGGNPSNQWGPTSINTITGDLEWIDDGTDSLGCFPSPAGSLTGKVALVRRGICNFSLKVYHAQEAGAVGCVICNHTPGENLINMLGGDSMAAVTIPSVFLSYEDCELLHQQVDAGTTTNVSFYVPSVYNTTSSFAYNTPVQHIQPLNNMSATIYNTSTASASNVVVTATINDPVGGQQVLTETLAALPGTYDSVVVFQNGYTPAAVGTYDIVFKTTLNPSDSVVQSFVINNDSTFALDNNDFTLTGSLGGIGPSDADFANPPAPNPTGATYFYEMGATYLTGPNTQSDATSCSFALQNANDYVGKDFIFLLYEEPAGGFLGTEQDYTSFNLIGGGLYTVTPADTMVPHSLMTAVLFDISTGANAVILSGNKQYMMMVRHAGDGSVTTSPKISYTHIQDYLSIAATTYVGRLFMAGWNPSYAPVIRMHVQDLLTSVEQSELNLTDATIFPNPTNERVNLSLNLQEVSENVTVQLLNVSGKALQVHSYKNVQEATYTYNVEDLPAGLYLMHIQTDHGQTMKKVIVK